MPTQPAVLGTARLNNFRLHYLPSALAADRALHVRIILGGVDITQPDSPTRLLYKSLTIRDLVFDAPNTCACTLYGVAPTVGQAFEVWINSDAPVLLFGGELQTVARTYKGRPTTVVHPCTAIDDTARANRRRPLGLFTNVSATTIAETLLATYAPGYSSAGVEAGLPPISINFDGSEGGMKGCLTAIAKLIGGYWYFEHKTLYLFVTPPGPAPDPIDETPGRFLHDPPITWSVDKSQVRTRVYGKGASTRVGATVATGTAVIPVQEATMFNPAGGRAIHGVTPDGAASNVVTYTGVQLGGGGGLIGPGAAPSAVPGLALQDGAGMESGVHRYAYTFVTASGESLPSAAAAITVGTFAPTAAPVPGAPTAGGSVDLGTHYYVVTFVTAVGETLAGPASAPVETLTSGHYVPPPTNTLLLSNVLDAMTTAYQPGDQMTFRYAYVNAQGITTAGPLSAPITAIHYGGQPAAVSQGIKLSGLTVSPDPSVTKKRVYRYKNGVFQGSYETPNEFSNYTDGSGETVTGLAPQASNTAFVSDANYQTVPLTSIPIGPANVTARKIYRYSNAGPSYYLVDTIANNTTTTYTDTKASASLGAPWPAANTAPANQVRVTVGVGAAAVTARNVYRSAANLTPLQLLTTIANNTAATLTDVASDATLGAAPPSTDSSGLAQPSGQVPAGAAAIIVANTAPFADVGGWAVVGNGEQVIRYTAKTASSLTGIPPTGPGALVASVSYNSTITAAPALVGVVGLLETLKGAPMHVWVQRDDTAAQAYLVTLDGGGDGVYEHIVSDERRSEASLAQVCEAELALYSRPLVTVTYASRDLKTKSGKTVAIALTSPAITESLTIQDVAITEIGLSPRLAPKFTVTASSVHHTFEAILRKLIREAGA